MKMLRNRFASSASESEGHVKNALHKMLVEVITGAVERCDDADAYAEKAAKAFAKGLAVFDKECAASTSAGRQSNP